VPSSQILGDALVRYRGSSSDIRLSSLERTAGPGSQHRDRPLQPTNDGLPLAWHWWCRRWRPAVRARQTPL